MKLALKEWSLIIDQLVQGRQIVVFRSGGLADKPEAFEVSRPEFLLFPSFFHEQEKQLRSDRTETQTMDSDAGSEASIPIQCFAREVDRFVIRHPEQVPLVRKHHQWKDEVLLKRMKSGKHAGLVGLILRVYQLPKVAQIAPSPRYGGCRSWIQLESDVDIEGGQAVLQDQVFNQMHQSLLEALA